jgi:hypothetical protein
MSARSPMQFLCVVLSAALCAETSLAATVRIEHTNPVVGAPGTGVGTYDICAYSQAAGSVNAVTSRTTTVGVPGSPGYAVTVVNPAPVCPGAITFPAGWFTAGAIYGPPTVGVTAVTKPAAPPPIYSDSVVSTSPPGAAPPAPPFASSVAAFNWNAAGPVVSVISSRSAAGPPVALAAAEATDPIELAAGSYPRTMSPRFRTSRWSPTSTACSAPGCSP